MNKEVYLEELRLWYIPHILFYKIMGWDIYIFGLELSIKKRFYTHWLIRSKWINRINTHFYPMGNSHSKALKMTNKLIETMKSNSNIQCMMELYGDEEVLLVFKRSLVEKLVVLTSIHEYLNNRSSKNNAKNSKFLLYLGKNSEYFTTLRELGHELKFMPTIEVIRDTSILRILESICKSWKYMIVSTSYTIHLLLQSFNVKKNIKRNNYRYCISVPNKFYEKFTGPRKYTFLMNDKDITREETIFLFEYTPSSQFIKKQKSKGINILVLQSGIKNFISCIFKRSILKPKRELKILSLLMLKFWQPSYIIDGVCCLLIQRLQWSILTSKIQFDDYIFSNKEEISQIAINIFLRKQKTITWHYTQFNGGPYQMESELTPYDDRNILWSYHNSDNFLLYHKAMYLSMSKHYQKVKNYIVIGNIFSEMINSINKNDALDKIVYSNNKINKHNKHTSQIVVSIFDTTYANVKNIFSTYCEAQAFLSDFISLAKMKPEFLFIFKPSKTDDEFLDPNHICSLLTVGDTIKNINEGKKIVALRKEFSSLPNTLMLSDNADPIEVISASDVVITNCFSSPTADALSAGKPAFWYQSGDNVRGYPLDEIEGLVGHGSSELLDMLNDSLSPNYMEKLYTQSLYHDNVDSFMDCQALTRLRNELCRIN